MLLLLLSGLCDAFDGKVARTKKNRTKAMQNFGIQIDSLADIVAFGILPVCIGLALWNHSATHAEAGSFVLPHSVPILISCLYILAAVVRLAYFNVTEEERQSTGASKREFYTGLPVTSASLIFPTLVLLQRITRADLCWLYHAVMLATAGAFVGKFHVKKPNLRGILILVALGAAGVPAVFVAPSGDTPWLSSRIAPRPVLPLPDCGRPVPSKGDSLPRQCPAWQAGIWTVTFPESTSLDLSVDTGWI